MIPGCVLSFGDAVSHYEEALSGLASGHPLAFADRRVIEHWFSYNSEHPPLMKTLYGIS